MMPPFMDVLSPNVSHEKLVFVELHDIHSHKKAVVTVTNLRTQKIFPLLYHRVVYMHILMYRCITPYIVVFFPVALRPNAGHGLLILEVSRLHTTTRHSR